MGKIQDPKHFERLSNWSFGIVWNLEFSTWSLSQE